MVKVQLCDRLGNVVTKKIGFSWIYFVFGPLYSFFRGYIFSSTLLLLLTYYLLPFPGMDFFASLIMKISFIDVNFLTFITKVMLIFRTHYYFILGAMFVLLFRIVNAFFFRSRRLRRYMKKKEVRPLEEIDARILIKYHACNESISLAENFDLRKSSTYKSAEENWYEDNQTRINTTSPSENNRYSTRTMSHTKIAIKKEQIENLYKLGLISREEYLSRLNNVDSEITSEITKGENHD